MAHIDPTNPSLNVSAVAIEIFVIKGSIEKIIINTSGGDDQGTNDFLD